MRLRLKAEFAAMRRGRVVRCGQIKLIYIPNNQIHMRLGLAVSRRYGNAVRRNRLKRQLRAAFRTSEQARKLSADILVVATTTHDKTVNPAKSLTDALVILEHRMQA
ncbi:MAG: ribonuclease P protein component [Mariprofundales bacterium]